MNLKKRLSIQLLVIFGLIFLLPFSVIGVNHNSEGEFRMRNDADNLREHAKEEMEYLGNLLPTIYQQS
jgi:hypothetical protein